MYWKQKFYNKLLVNASKNISIIICSSIDLGQVGIGLDLKGCLKYGFERLLVIGLNRLFNVLLEWLFNNHKVVLMILWNVI
jgi:hypothetical protein